MKAFPAIVKRSKFYERKTYIKLKDKCIREILWQACWKIAQLLMKEEASENKFCWFVEWYKLWINFCDYRFSSKRLYHFEESSVAIDRIVLIEEGKWSRWYDLESELIDAHVLLSPEKKKMSKKSADFSQNDKGDGILLN